jgi:hypothetical protein
MWVDHSQLKFNNPVSARREGTARLYFSYTARMGDVSMVIPRKSRYSPHLLSNRSSEFLRNEQIFDDREKFGEVSHYLRRGKASDWSAS